MKGVRADAHSLQAFVKVRGIFRSKRFPHGTPDRELSLWRDETRLRLLGRIAPQPVTGDTLSVDVRRYLRAVRQMPTYTWRENDLYLWTSVLGHRVRSSIASVEIRTQLERWRKKYAASTVNHRRTALMHLWTVLDGKSAPNPVKDVPRYRETQRPPRALSPKIIAKLLAAMPASLTKARLTLMAWTGWPHAQIMRLEPSDIDWNRAVYIRPRQKGGGVAGRWLPLLPQAWAALRAFKRAGAWGTFSTSAMRTSLRLAASKVDPKLDITPYDLRHSFLTLVALAGKDDRAVSALGLHSDPRMSRRYTEASVDPRVANALTAVAKFTKPARKRA